jgi:hypothetical protein
VDAVKQQRRSGFVAVAVLGGLANCLAAGCTAELNGLDADAAPLAELQVQVTGDLQAFRPLDTLKETPRLRLGLLWGAQVQADPFCLPLPGDASMTAVRVAGCRDPFGFSMARLGPSVALEPGKVTRLPLMDLPLADLLIGDLTARIAYASVVVYDDRNGNGVLDQWRASEFPSGDTMGPGKGGPGGGGSMGGEPAPVVEKPDLIYAASFVSMTQPDRRLAYREGGYDGLSFYYPRWGCPDPPKGFSLVGAGGFNLMALITGLFKPGASGVTLPQMASESCSSADLGSSVLELALQPTPTFQDLICARRAGSGMSSGIIASGSVTYREPPVKALPLDKISWVCAPVAQGGGEGKGGMGQPGSAGSTPLGQPKPAIVELMVSGLPGGCRTLTHYIPRGCSTDPYCDQAEWEPAAPPAWWPCHTTSEAP